MMKALPVITVLTAAALFVTGCSDEPTAPDAPTAAASGAAAEPAATDPLANATTAQRNAVKSATSYLEIGPFSRSGLIKQLEFDQYSTADATFAVDHVKPDYNAEAARAAKSYLEIGGYSRGSLVDQLVFDGFSAEEAAHGATAAGLQ